MDYQLSIPRSGWDSSLRETSWKVKKLLYFQRGPYTTDSLWVFWAIRNELLLAYGHSPQKDDLQEPNVETEFRSTGISLSLGLDMAFSVLTCKSEYKKVEKNKQKGPGWGGGGENESNLVAVPDGHACHVRKWAPLSNNVAAFLWHDNNQPCIHTTLSHYSVFRNFVYFSTLVISWKCTNL
jgi:hypothetical protein